MHDWFSTLDAARRRDLILSLGIPIAIAAIAFLTAQATYPRLPVVQDAYCYNLSAQRLLVDGFFAHAVEPPGSDIEPNAVTTPAYQLMLAGVYAVTGSISPDAEASILAVMPAVRVLQFMMALGIVVCIAAAGRLLGGWRFALASGVLAALYLPFAWSASVALSEVVGALFLSLQLLLAVRLAGKSTQADASLFAAFGLASAVLALVRPVMALWVVVPVVMIAIVRRREAGRVAKLLAIALGAFLLLMGPWWIRNAVVLERFVPLSEGAGLPMVQAAGGMTMTVDEQALWSAERSQGRDGFLAVAKARLAAQWSEDPVKLVGARATRALVVAGQMWSAPMDVYWEKYHTPDGAGVGMSEFPVAPTPQLIALSEFARYYHVALLVSAVPGLVLVRRSPRMLLALSLPLYSMVVHLPTLFINRYFFPVMPAVILSAGAVIVVGSHALRGYVTRSRTDESVHSGARG